MSYASSEQSFTITVQNVTLQLSVSPQGPWTAGQTVNVTVTASQDPGEIIDINIMVQSGGVTLAGPTLITSCNMPSGSNVSCSTSFQVPFQVQSGSSTVEVPGSTLVIYAVGETTGAESNSVSGNVLYPTRITNINVYPSQSVVVGEKVQISGTLQFEQTANNWLPLGGQPVGYEITTVQGGETITVVPPSQVSTASDGSFTFTWTPSQAGSYTVTIAFPANMLAIAGLGLTGVHPLQYAPSVVTFGVSTSGSSSSSTQTGNDLIYTIAGVAALAAVGGGLYYYYKKRGSNA